MPWTSSIGAKLFSKVEILVEISKISKNLKNLKRDSGGRSCSTSYPSGNQVDGSPLVAMNFVVGFMFLMIFCIMVTSFVTFRW